MAHMHFQILNPIPSFPRPAVLGTGSPDDASYAFSGRSRKDRPHCIFQFTLSGHGMFLDAGGEHRITQGAGFLCESDDPATAYRYPPDATEPWRFIYLAFMGQASHIMVRDLVKRHGGVYRLAANKGIVKRLRTYHAAGLTESPISASEGARLVTELLAALASSAEAQQEAAPDNVLVREAMEMVRELINSSLSVSDIARPLNVSREHLTRVFKEQTGVSPYQFIVRKKMLAACRMLKGTNQTVNEIALYLGFEVPAHFNRTFKRVIKMTPGRFREAGVMPVL